MQTSSHIAKNEKHPEAVVALSVLIPTHGRPTLLERTLRSLAACRLPAGYRETVVVENGSRAGAEDVVAEIGQAHPALRLRYMHVERANKSHALNEALATVGDGLAVFFDDDVRLDPGVLEAYAEAVETHPERAYFGGSVRVDYEERPPEWIVERLCMSARGYDLNWSNPHLFLGYNWAAFVKDLRAVGGFDTNLGPGTTIPQGDEPELQSRLAKAAASAVKVPGAWVAHYVPPERCSTEWVVKRRYSNGVSQGYRAMKLELKRTVLLKRALFGIVVGSVTVVRATINREEAARWQAIDHISFNRGLLYAALAWSRLQAPMR